jgi:drug/metabolite transporter (DMT)-like permease
MNAVQKFLEGSGKRWTLIVFISVAVVGIICLFLDKLLTQHGDVILLFDVYGKYLNIIFKYWAVIAGGVAAAGVAKKVTQAVVKKSSEDTTELGTTTETNPEGSPTDVLKKQGKLWSYIIFMGVIVVGLICLILDKLTGSPGQELLIDTFGGLCDVVYNFWLVLAGGVAVTGVVSTVKETKAITTQNEPL